MKDFYIGFSYSDKIGSYALKKYMKSEFSHCFIEFDTSRNVLDNTIFHSTMSSGVAYWSNRNFEKHNTKTHLYEIEVTQEMFYKLRQVTHKHAGDHYAHMQNLGILIVELLQNLGINISNPFTDNENCSELVYLFLRELHPELQDKYNRNTIRPDHIKEILDTYGYKNILGE